MLKWVIGYSPFGIKRPREARTARPIGSLAYNALSVASSSGMPEQPCGSASSGPQGQRDESCRLSAIRIVTIEHVRVGIELAQSDEKCIGHSLWLKHFCPFSENMFVFVLWETFDSLPSLRKSPMRLMIQDGERFFFLHIWTFTCTLQVKHLERPSCAIFYITDRYWKHQMCEQHLCNYAAKKSVLNTSK